MNENKKGQNTLYAVIGVATLVVAIIGATFAYFSAQATAGANVIQGGTNDVGGALTLNVARLSFYASDDATKPASDNLIPADLQLDDDSAPTDDEISDIMTAKCVNNGYTGCHVYKITTHATQAVSAKLILQNFDVTATDKASWKYIVFKGSDTTADGVTSAITVDNNFNAVTGSFDTTAGSVDDATLDGTASPFGKVVNTFNMARYAETDDETTPEVDETTNEYYYYLMIYLANKDAAQNDANVSENNAVGTYSGNVLLDAGDGAGLVATFTHTAG